MPCAMVILRCSVLGGREVSMKTYRLWIVGLLADGGELQLSEDTIRFVWWVMDAA